MLRELPTLTPAARMSPPHPTMPWRFGVPQLETSGELARFLDLTPAELDWFADQKH